ncbi:metallophosphoesterase [Pelagicoccus sp. SDUM812002]|uniref:metallophosphoesterase family protein n=1 Tax=Pelagicoccus sp. SDUM812002 TaxID=3041266 RepID=UPI0028103654|nr:metallophosphoesterase [Pelagicoccus sp. SDUM812002]MDQ8183959.1 metallophosphoesterase [Pelagicoccus sp. SDUM812002]
MKKVAWLTDLHLEFADDYASFKSLCSQLHKIRPDAILIGGDTGLSYSFDDYIQSVADKLNRPVYFVLGNHDCYHGSIAKTKKAAVRLDERSRLVRYLTVSGVVELTPYSALVGHDGWADGRLGLGRSSPVELNDYRLIEEFVGLGLEARFDLLNQLGDRASEELKQSLVAALDRYKDVIVLTHVPPFRESCWHEGRFSDDAFLPHFSSKAMGEMLAEVARAYPDRNLKVLCGHTHGAGESQIASNLVVKTGGAEYGRPAVQELVLVK